MEIFLPAATLARAAALALFAALAGWSPAGSAQTVQPALAELLARGTVDAVTQPDGKIIAYGSFERIGSTARRNLARFHADGTLDAGWAPEPDGFVRTVVVDAAGNIFVGGEFRRIGGRDAPVLAKLLPGPAVQRDPAYASGVPALATAVNALLLADDGSHYAAWSAPASVNGVARLFADGSADGGFALGANNLVLNLALSTDQQALFVSGLFSLVNSTAVTGAVAKVAAATGVLDPGWAPLSGTVRVRDMLNDGAGHLLLAGNFSAYPAGFVRVATTGSGSPAAWGPAFVGATSPVLGYGLARFPDGDVLALGTFFEADGQPHDAGIARLAPDGSLRAGWGNVSLPGTIGTQPNGHVDANGVATIWRFAEANNRTRLYQLGAADGADLARLGQSGVALFGGVNVIRRQPGSNRVLVGGATLAEVNGRTSLGVVALQPNLKPDTAWTSRLADSVGIGGTAALAASAQSVFLGSFAFGAQTSVTVSGLNRVDGATGALTTWAARRDATTLMGAITPTGLALDETGGFVYASSNLVMRDAANQVVANGNLLRFALSDGIADLGWNPAFTGTTSVTPTVAIDANYLYYATNRNITATDGSAVPSLARIPLVGNGRADATWKPLASNLVLRSLVLAGGFAYIGGDNTLQRVALASGAVDSSWTPSLAPGYSVRDISVALDGSVYLAGTFPADCLGLPTSALRLAADGSVDDNWGVGVDAAVGAVFALPDGSVLLSGAFRRINGKVRTGLAHLFPSDLSEHCIQKQVETPTASADAAATAAVPDGSGRYIVLQSDASNLVAGDADGSSDIFRVDTACVAGLDPAGAPCERVVPVSVDDAEGEISGDAVAPALSADGALVAFVAQDAGVMKVYGESAKRSSARRKGGGFGVFMRNMITGNTFRLGGAAGPAAQPQIAPAGNAVVFPQPNAPGQPGRLGQNDIYYMPIARSGGVTLPGAAPVCISCKAFDANGEPTVVDAEGDSSNPVVSADGQWIAWQTEARNALATPTPCTGPGTDVLLRNLITGATQRMGAPASPSQCGSNGSGQPSLDYSGQRLVFTSDNTLAGVGGQVDVYLLDRVRGTQERISAHPDGGTANGDATQPAISGDGETIAFVSSASDLDPADVDGNEVPDVFVYSARERLRRRLARTSTGSESNRASQRPALTYSGTKVLFDSAAGNLVPGAVEDQENVYERASPVDVDKVFRASFD